MPKVTVNQRLTGAIIGLVLLAVALFLNSSIFAVPAASLGALFVFGLAYKNWYEITFFFQAVCMRLKLWYQPSAETWNMATIPHRIAYVSLMPVKDTYVKWVAQDFELVVCVTAGRRTSNQNLLEQLSGHPSAIVRKAVGENPHTRPAALRELTKSPQWLVRETVLRNPNCPSGLLEQCVTSATNGCESSLEPGVGLTEALTNPSMPGWAFEHLAVFGPMLLSGVGSARDAAIQNPSCPKWLVQAINQDINLQQAVLERHLSEEETEVGLGLTKDWSGSLTCLFEAARNVCAHVPGGRVPDSQVPSA